MTNDTLTRLGIAMVLVAACDMPEDPRRFQNWATTDCHLMDTTTTRYGRPYGMTSGCAATPAPAGSSAQSAAGKDAAAGAASAAAKATSSTPAAPPAANPGAAPLPDDKRYPAFDAACVRDSQCGPGKCMAGDCFYGCQTDAECGSGDRCSVESGARICQPDPNPPVTCTRNAQCAEASVCLDGSCRQTCSSTDDCVNLLDRCQEGICQPDRRPLVECVLNSECGAGLVCLDGACAEPCRAGGDAGPCPNGSAAPGTQPETGAAPAAAPHAAAGAAPAAPAAASPAADAPTSAAASPAAASPAVPAAAAPPAESANSVGPTLPELPPGGNLFEPAPEGPDAGVATDTSGASPEIR